MQHFKNLKAKIILIIIQLSKNVKQTIPILQSKEYIQTIIKEIPK